MSSSCIQWLPHGYLGNWLPHHESALKEVSCPKRENLIFFEESNSTPLTINGHFFRGYIFNATTGIGIFDTPIRDSSGALIGRLVGCFNALEQLNGVATVAIGTWNFEFFKTPCKAKLGPYEGDQKDIKGLSNWISASTGFDNTTTTPQTAIPDVILNGNGIYANVSGRVKNHLIVPGDSGYDAQHRRVRWEIYLN